MGQEEAFQVLKSNGGWMKTKEIAKVLGITPSSAAASLTKLWHRGDIIVKNGDRINRLLWRVRC